MRENCVVGGEKTLRKDLLVVAAVSCLAAVVVTALVIFSVAPTLNVWGHVGVDFEATSVHSRIRVYKDGVLVFSEYHPGVVTNLGDNMTLFKLFGDTDMQYVDIPFTDNATYISIGNQGSLSASSVVLPGEWNRTAGAIDNESQSSLNVSCTFYPDNAGPYTADCIGLNFNATASANNLWAYDTFTEVSGIDETYTINVDFSVSVSHS